ncbi:MAG: Crp/Fnr family transcriptional regulator [Erysipelotrichales bacterium]|nr:Crp/Fnr family transcriptional regulator [Erysipelotrichales bacterium]
MSKILDLISVLTNEERSKVQYLEFKNGEIIHFGGSTCTSVDILLKGEIIMSNLDVDGNEQVFNYLRAPQIYGNNLIFASNKVYLGDILANSDVAIYRIYESDLLSLISSNRQFLKLYLNVIADKSVELSKRLRVMSVQNVTRRLLLFIDMKSKENSGSYHIKSITNLAKELSLPRETVSRVINSLVKEEKIIYENKCLTINKNALDEL